MFGRLRAQHRCAAPCIPALIPSSVSCCTLKVARDVPARAGIRDAFGVVSCPARGSGRATCFGCGPEDLLRRSKPVTKVRFRTVGLLTCSPGTPALSEVEQAVPGRARQGTAVVTGESTATERRGYKGTADTPARAQDLTAVAIDPSLYAGTLNGWLIACSPKHRNADLADIPIAQSARSLGCGTCFVHKRVRLCVNYISGCSAATTCTERPRARPISGFTMCILCDTVIA